MYYIYIYIYIYNIIYDTYVNYILYIGKLVKYS